MIVETNDQLGVAHSLKERIEEETSVNTIHHFDGMSYPEEKPFIIVKQRFNQPESVSKAKETVRTTRSYEIGLFGKSLRNRSELRDELSDLFMFGTFPLYTKNGERVKGKSFEIIDATETYLDAEEFSDDTKTHRMYFDIEVESIQHKTNYKGR